MKKSDYRPTLKLAREYIALPGNEMGGNLHIVLDDGNLETKHIQYCSQCAFEEGDVKGYQLAAHLLPLSMTQRKKVYLNLRKKESL